MKRITLPSENNHVSDSVWLLDESGQPKELITDDFDEYIYIKKLQEYEDLEEQGKLPKLPCAVGDTVYRINKGAKRPVIPLQVINFKIFGNLSDNFKMECADEWGGGYTYRKTDIGKGIFLTQEKAEAALKELQRRTRE